MFKSDQECLLDKFKQWSEWSGCRDRTRRRMLIACQRWKVAHMAAGLHQWRVWSIERKRELDKREKETLETAELMERCLHGSMVCHLRKHWLRVGFTTLRRHAHATAAREVKVLHREQMSSLTSAVEERLNGIRASIGGFRHRAMVICLSRSLSLVGRLSVQRAFGTWAVNTVTNRNEEDLLTTMKLLYLERVVGRRRRRNLVSVGKINFSFDIFKL